MAVHEGGSVFAVDDDAPDEDDGLYLGTLDGRAAQLVDWDRTHRFCGQCAAPTAPVLSERARRYPRWRAAGLPIPPLRS